jgi:hypothetical protein
MSLSPQAGPACAVRAGRRVPCRRAPVAQRIRAADFGSAGRGFESLRARQYHLLRQALVNACPAAEVTRDRAQVIGAHYSMRSKYLATNCASWALRFGTGTALMRSSTAPMSLRVLRICSGSIWRGGVGGGVAASSARRSAPWAMYSDSVSFPASYASRRARRRRSQLTRARQGDRAGRRTVAA